MPLLPALGLILSPEQTDKLATELKQAPSDGAKPGGRKRSASESDVSGKRGEPTAPDLDKARFEQRWSKLGPGVSAIHEAIQKKLYCEMPSGGEFLLSATALHQLVEKMASARDDGRFAEADKLLLEAEKERQLAEAAFPAQNDKIKKVYLDLKAKCEPVIKRFDEAVGAGLFGTPPHPSFADMVTMWQVNRGRMAQGEKDANYLLANRGLDIVKEYKRSFAGVSQGVAAEWTALRNTATDLVDGAGSGAFPGIDAKGLRSALSNAQTTAGSADQQDLWGAAATAHDLLGPAITGFRLGAAKAIVAGGAKPKALRAQAMAMLKKDPSILKAVQAEPGGKDAIDAMVKDVDGAAKSADDKDFMKAAIEARFGSKVTGDLTTKFLPRLYNALGMVPESHTKNNEKLTEIHRTRVKLMPSGDYDFDESKKKGLINLVTPKTGTVDWLQSKVMAMGAKKIVGHLGGKDISTFDALTLHEVGHAVDEQKAFMKGKAGNVLYGGWQDHSVEEVAKFLGDARGFFKDFAKLPRTFLEAYLTAVLQKKSPEKTGAVTSAVDKGVKVDWKALAKHAATDTAEHIRMKGAGGLWDKGDGGAATYAIGNTVFQEAYENQWVSYALSARGQKLTNYQFRSEAEWFAEPYAAFFLGKLKPSHPLYAMLQEDKGAAKSAQKAAK